MTYFLLDPTVVFTILVVLIPIGFELQPEPKIDLIKTYLLHPPFLICCALIIILEAGALLSPTVKKGLPPARVKNGKYKQNKPVRYRNILSPGEYMVSRWYLMNGLIYHSLMDPICGFMQNWSLMTKQYSYLDSRFAHPYQVGSEAATLTVWLEGAVMCPLCVIIFIGYRYILPRYRNSAKNQGEYSKIIWIYCLEFIVLLCQSLGTYFFYGAEFILLLTGQDTHMPYAKNIKELDFDLWENFYFWFGTVFMVGLWIVIPIIMMIRAQREIANLVLDDHGIQRRKKRN